MSRDEKRPEGGGNLQQANDENTASGSITLSLQRTGPLLNTERIRRRARLRAEERRSKESRRFNALIAEPREIRSPATFEMTPDERRAYGAELLANGWQRWEIRARLAAPEGVHND